MEKSEQEENGGVEGNESEDKRLPLMSQKGSASVYKVHNAHPCTLCSTAHRSFLSSTSLDTHRQMIKKTCEVCTVEFYSVIKQNEIISFVGTGM